MTEKNSAQPGLKDAVNILRALRGYLKSHRINGPTMLCTDGKALNNADDEVLRALEILVPLSKLRAEGALAGRKVAKAELPRVQDAEGTIHYEADSLSGNVTLCGLTDWIGQGPGKETKKAVTCDACKSVVTWVQSGAALASAPVAGPMSDADILELFKRNCVDFPGNYEVTPGQALVIAKRLMASAPVSQPSAPVASTEQVSGHDRLLRAAATQEAKDGIGAMDALFELAVKHGASRTAAAGFAHVANGAFATLEGHVHDEIGRRSVAERASAPVAGDWPARWEAMRHEANEWADMAINGLQWVRNIQDGTSTADKALANLNSNLAHCRATQARTAPESAPVAGGAVAIPQRPLTEDERAAIEFYTLNPSAAVRDLDKRLFGHSASEKGE